MLAPIRNGNSAQVMFVLAVVDRLRKMKISQWLEPFEFEMLEASRSDGILD